MSRKRRSGHRPSTGLEPLADVLVRASSEAQDRGPLPLAPWLWEQAVGPRIARRARPIRLERGILTVRAATSVWAQELSFLAPTIIAQLASLGLAVQSVRFSVGPVEAPTLVPGRRSPAVEAPAPPIGPELAGSIARIADAELRAAIERAAAANIAWQSRVPKGPAISAKPTSPGPRSVERETSARARTTPATPARSRDKP